MGGAIQEGGPGWGIGGAVPEIHGGMLGPSESRGCPCTPHSALRQLNVEWVPDITVVGNGGHMTNWNVNSGLRLHISFGNEYRMRVYGRCSAQNSEASTPPTRL